MAASCESSPDVEWLTDMLIGLTLVRRATICEMTRVLHRDRMRVTD